MAAKSNRRILRPCLDRLETRALLSNIPTVPGNEGFIRRSQFQWIPAGEIDRQWRGVTVDGPVSIREVRPGGESPPFPIPRPVANAGNVVDSQFNAPGFSQVGMQWRRVRVGGSVAIDVFDDTPGLVRPGGVPDQFFSTTNVGDVQHSQFNDGGFGNVGFQFADVRIRGSVGIAVEIRAFETPATSPSEPLIGDRPPRRLGSTNAGLIRDSQFNDGGFGDIGFQWSNVVVGGSTATSSNRLSIQPRVGGGGPITVGGIVFSGAGSTADVQDVQGGPPSERSPRTRATFALPSESENQATNSGRVLRSQFNDGGFGDVGLQWRNVRVTGDVGAVHNSLSIQPENDGQELITVQDVSFPSRAQVPRSRGGETGARSMTTPPLIVQDGSPVATPRPTRPFDRTFDRNYATNSGLIADSQFNDGGFGDQGLQWWNVAVRGDVQLIHNSLSVHPEGNDLEGVVVSNIRFGNSARFDAASMTGVGSRSQSTTSKAGEARNDRILIHRQFSDSSQADVFLQWDGKTQGYGVVVVNNIVQIDANANVIVEDVEFPDQPLTAVSPRLAAFGRNIVNAATNSGILRGNQFNDGGFGDIGMQWRNVRVAGSTTVVHNTLSIDVVGTNTGPISVSNVVFDSGAWSGSTTQADGRSHDGRPESPGEEGDHATNSGVLIGGQFTAGGLGHVALQWRAIRIRGPVLVMDNVLSIQSADPNSALIHVSNVRFG